MWLFFSNPNTAFSQIFSWKHVGNAGKSVTSRVASSTDVITHPDFLENFHTAMIKLSGIRFEPKQAKLPHRACSEATENYLSVKSTSLQQFHLALYIFCMPPSKQKKMNLHASISFMTKQEHKNPQFYLHVCMFS